VASSAGGARFNFDDKKSGFLTGVDSGVTAMRGAAGWCVGVGVGCVVGWDGWVGVGGLLLRVSCWIQTVFVLGTEYTHTCICMVN
jgi:hypothetical protein